jgi:hypothetical protein
VVLEVVACHQILEAEEVEAAEAGHRRLLEALGVGVEVEEHWMMEAAAVVARWMTAAVVEGEAHLMTVTVVVVAGLRCL